MAIEHYAQSSDLLDNEFYDDDDEDYINDRYLSFHIKEEQYCIEIIYVTEIVGLQKITEVPDMPDFVRGVINLRGQVIPVVDLRLRFNLPEKEYTDRTCVVIINLENTVIGLVVDSVEDVSYIAPEQVSPPPAVSAAGTSRFIKGLGRVGDDVRIILDVTKILYDSELKEIRVAK
jgi:purine-binding chemotaxis protein CheW